MRLTGERPMAGATPDSLLAFHVAGYREVAARLGPGTVLDVGSGTGAETLRLAGAGREVVGIDYDPAAAAGAARDHGPAGLRFLACDGARLAVRDGAFDHVCSSHIIEHFFTPEVHVAELARVLRPAGTAFVITPNAPADFENPFHVYLFGRDELESLLRCFFDDVEVWGLEGSDAIHADFASRRASGERLLRLDVLELRKRIPRRAYIAAYERLLPIVYRFVAKPEQFGGGSGIDDRDFFLTREIDDATPGLFAVARRPRI